MTSLHRLTCRVAALENLTYDIRCVRLRSESGGPLPFIAGQYASVTFPGQPPRDYSMANRPGEAELEFHIRFTSGGSASNFVAESLRVDDPVTVEGPLGESYLRAEDLGPILAIAGGSGLAPMKSIVESALAQGLRQPIHLYFGARTARDLYMEDRFAALAARHGNFRFTPVLSEPPAQTRYRTGFVHEAVAADHTDVSGFQAYLAGPPVMVEAATAMLLARGLAPERLHADAFYAAHEVAVMAKR